MYLSLFSILQAKYGENENDWYGKGIPQTVRLKCAERFEKDGRVRGVETYIDLIDYRKISEENWDLFQDVISIDTGNGNRKSDRTKWIMEVNSIRNNISHHTREGITHINITFLQEVWNKIDRLSSY